MHLINCKINLILIILNWSSTYVIAEVSRAKIYVSIVTLSTNDEVRLLDQLKSDYDVLIMMLCYDYNLMIEDKAFLISQEKTI